MSSKVYFIRASMKEGEESISEKARKLFKAGGFSKCFEEKDFTAIKVHVGEYANTTHLKAGCIKSLIDELLNLKTISFITDTSTLYTGQRHNAVAHSILAANRGFTVEKLGVPFIVTDGLYGNTEVEIKIDGQHNNTVFIASDIVKCQSILSIAHMTGHIVSGFGGSLKTIGMGCASRKGKMKQHAALTLSIGEKCTSCGECEKHCPADAITLDDVKAHIDQDKCIGCAECKSFCRFDAVECNWGEESEILQKCVAEYALGALKGKEKRVVFYNFLLSVTKDCDCFNTTDVHKITDDIGLVASRDPVAVDKASLDLLEEATGKKLQELINNVELEPSIQIEHAERLGLGRQKYELIEIQ